MWIAQSSLREIRRERTVYARAQRRTIGTATAAPTRAPTPAPPRKPKADADRAPSPQAATMGRPCGRQAGDASQADRELPGGMTGGNVNGGGGVERNVERVMTKIKFESVFAPAMEGHGQRSIILRVDGEEVWEGHIGQGEIVNINVTLPIQTLSVELGTRRFDEHGNPDGFLNYKHLVEIPHPSEEDVWKVTLFDDNMTRALFRSRIDGLGGKFELEVSFHG